MATVREMAELAGVTEATVRNWALRGEVKATRGGGRGAFDVDANSVRAHVGRLRHPECRDCGAVLEAEIVRSGQLGTPVWTDPSGWTEIATIKESGVRLAQKCWLKRAGASESAPTVEIDNAGGGWSACISAWRGAIASGSPIDGTPTTQFNTANNTATSPSVTTTVDESLVIKWYASADNNDLGSFSAPQSEAFGGSSYATTAGSDHAQGCGYYAQATAGASGTDTCTETVNGPDDSSAIAFAIKPPASGETVEGAISDETKLSGTLEPRAILNASI